MIPYPIFKFINLSIHYTLSCKVISLLSDETYHNFHTIPQNMLEIHQYCGGLFPIRKLFVVFREHLSSIQSELFIVFCCIKYKIYICLCSLNKIIFYFFPYNVHIHHIPQAVINLIPKFLVQSHFRQSICFPTLQNIPLTQIYGNVISKYASTRKINE